MNQNHLTFLHHGNGSLVIEEDQLELVTAVGGAGDHDAVGQILESIFLIFFGRTLQTKPNQVKFKFEIMTLYGF
jgi:hypothetical protein